MAEQKKTNILILGAGFGGMAAALRLDRTLARDSNISVTLVDKNNFSLFTPMLHEVAASDLDPADIVNPLRKMLRHVNFYEARVESIDLNAKSVGIAFGLPPQRRQLPYDLLVLALGGSTKFFDEETKSNAIEMKTLGDAMLLRNRMVALLERASLDEDGEARRYVLTFVVAGGGFAGVETIGAMNDFLCEAIKSYPMLDPKMLRLILVHPGKVVLPEFSESLGKYTTEKLRESGIDVRLSTKVKSFDGTTIQLDPGDPIKARTLLWTAGVTTPQLIQDLPMKNEKGRVVVNACMESEEFPGVWVIGDCAHIPNPDKDGKPYPATAQHAIRQGEIVGRNVEAAVLKGSRQQKPFRYKMLGQLAAIGQRRGAALVLGFQFSGFFAWFLWRSTYLYKLPRLEKKIRVAIGWTIDLFFSRDLVQVITIEDLQRLATLAVKNKLVSAEHEGAESKANAER